MQITGKGTRKSFDRLALERAVAPASLSATLEVLHRNGILRGYRVLGDTVQLDADHVALELATEHLGRAAA
jgi:hypothetical protein